MDAFDSAEYAGSVLELLSSAEGFIKRNTRKMWRKLPDSREEYPEYQRLHYLRNAWNNPWRKIQYSLEELWLNLLQGNFSNITYAFKHRVRKWLGKEHHR